MGGRSEQVDKTEIDPESMKWNSEGAKPCDEGVGISGNEDLV